MTSRSFATPLPFPAAVVRRYHERPGALQRLLPPWDATEIVEQSGTVQEGDRVVMQMAPGVRWVAEHHPIPDGFSDEMVSGPISSWTHRHRFVDDGPDRSVIHDEIEFAPAAAAWLADARLERMFRFRARRLTEDLSRLATITPRRVLLAGASGLLGSQLSALLTAGGHDVVRLVRRTPGAGELRWNPDTGELNAAEIEGMDAVISLSGENVGEGAWTENRKVALVESRVRPTALLARMFGVLKRPPRVWLSASAVGIYGDRGEERLTERSAPGGGFLAELCERWEAAASTVADVRVVRLRLGVALTARGGALQKQLTPYRLGVGGPVAGGQQFLPWIAADDVLYATLHVLGDERLVGPVNVVAPQAVRQAEFASTLAGVLGRPALLPLPALAVRTLFGQMGAEVLLAGQNAAPERLMAGFRWAFPNLQDALQFELGAA